MGKLVQLDWLIGFFLLRTRDIRYIKYIFLIELAYTVVFLVSIRYRLYREITNKIRYIESNFISVGFVP